jgi:hypothetical protein
MPPRYVLCTLTLLVVSAHTLPARATTLARTTTPYLPRTPLPRRPARPLPLEPPRPPPGPRVTLRALAELPLWLPLPVAPDEAGERLSLLGGNARVHAQLRGLVAWVKSRLGKDLSLEAGPGLGLAIERRF